MGELEVTVGVHEQQIRALEARMKSAEEQQKQIQELTLSVRELAGSVKQLVERQQNHEERLDVIERAPGDTWNSVKRQLLMALCSAVAGGVFTMFITALK